MPTTVAADLCFQVDVPGGRTAMGHLHGGGSDLRLDIDDPTLFAGAGDAPAIRELAEELAARRIRIRVHADGKHLISLGHVTAPWWQRRLTRSPRVRIGSLRGAWTSARARTRGVQPVLPDQDMMPPTTLSPVFPTFGRRARRVTTTHDPSRGGSPRLVLVKQDVRGGERLPVFWLGAEVVIGSDPGCDIVLPRLAPRHAVVRHDEDDEFVIAPLDGATRVHGNLVESQILRTGSRVMVGDHRLVFRREEYADHGRPYGGRVGGELGHQRSQAPRQRPRSE